MQSSNKFKGIVTRRSELANESVIHVWSSKSHLKEYKFPRWSDKYTEWFLPGMIVQFEPTRDIDAVQEDTKIWAEKNANVEVIRKPADDPEFMVKTTIICPPPAIGYYDGVLALTAPLGCRALFWSCEFGKVALMDDQLDYKPGIFYTGFVTRINPQRDWIGTKMGTLWVLCTGVDSPFIPVNDPAIVARMHSRIPWNDQLISASSNNNIVDVGGGEGTLSVTSQQQQGSTTPLPLATNSSRPQNPLVLDDDDWTDFDPNNPILNGHQQREQQQNATEMGPNNAVKQPIVNGGAAVEGGGGIDTEAMIFGKLMTCKLEGIAARSPIAADQLQKSVLDLCDSYKLKMLNRDASTDQ